MRTHHPTRELFGRKLYSLERRACKLHYRHAGGLLTLRASTPQGPQWIQDVKPEFHYDILVVIIGNYERMRYADANEFADVIDSLRVGNYVWETILVI